MKWRPRLSTAREGVLWLSWLQSALAHSARGGDKGHQAGCCDIDSARLESIDRFFSSTTCNISLGIDPLATLLHDNDVCHRRPMSALQDPAHKRPILRRNHRSTSLDRAR